MVPRLDDTVSPAAGSAPRLPTKQTHRGSTRTALTPTPPFHKSAAAADTVAGPDARATRASGPDLSDNGTHTNDHAIPYRPAMQGQRPPHKSTPRSAATDPPPASDQPLLSDRCPPYARKTSCPMQQDTPRHPARFVIKNRKEPPPVLHRVRQGRNTTFFLAPATNFQDQCVSAAIGASHPAANSPNPPGHHLPATWSARSPD